MRIKKLSFLVVLIFAAAAVVSFASGSSESTSSTAANQKVTLNALFMKQASYSEQDVQNMTSDFEKANPNVTVTPEFVPYEALHDKIITAAAAGSGYDVVLFDVIWPAEFAKQGILRDITKDIPKSMIDQVLSGAWASSEYNGHYYGIPWILDTEYLFYNKQMLQQAGISAPPTSLQQLLEQAKTIKAKGIVKYPLIWAWQQSENVFLNYAVLVYGFGGSFFDQSGNPTFNSGGGLEALQYMVQSLKDGVSNPASLQAIADDEVRVFSSKQAAFALNWTYMYAIANGDSTQSSVVGQVGVVPAPGNGGSVPMSPINGSMALGVTQFSQHPTQALDYIKFLTNVQEQEKYAELSFPIWKSFYNEPSKWPKGLDPLVTAAKTSFAKLYDRPLLSNYTQFSTIMQKYLQSALLNQMTPKQALDAAAKEVVSAGANK